MYGPITLDIQNCARCGLNHPQLTLRPFLRRPTTLRLTHWAACPRSGDPILYRSPSEEPEDHEKPEKAEG